MFSFLNRKSVLVLDFDPKRCRRKKRRRSGSSSGCLVGPIRRVEDGRRTKTPSQNQNPKFTHHPRSLDHPTAPTTPAPLRNRTLRQSSHRPRTRLQEPRRTPDENQRSGREEHQAAAPGRSARGERRPGRRRRPPGQQRKEFAGDGRRRRFRSTRSGSIPVVRLASPPPRR